MIHVMLFSKDRPCQLDLTLSTLKKYFKEWQDQKYSLLYTYTNEEYRKGYERVFELHKDMDLKVFKETNFHNDTVAICNASRERKYLTFLVDDDVFVDYFSTEDKEFKKFEADPTIICLSARMAPYINFCYTANIPSPPPALGPDNVWNWKAPGLAGDWCYPMSIASFHVFRTEDLIPIIMNRPFRAPNSFEGTCLAPYPPNRTNMICYDSAKCICTTVNRVQTENTNRHDNLYNIEFLNKQFLSGFRISPDSNHQLKIKTAHGPIRYEWIKGN